MDREFVSRVDAARAGYIYAHDGKAYDRWKAGLRRGGQSGGLTGRSLEGHVMGLAITARRLVAMPGETPRRLTRDGLRKRKTPSGRKATA